MKVLVVDDSKAMRMIVKKSLRSAGFGDWEVLEAANGAEALGIVASSRPDLILSDWNMPEMSGPDFLKAVRDAGHSTKFGFITSQASDDVRHAAAQHGALFVIRKPFTPESLREALQPVMS